MNITFGKLDLDYLWIGFKIIYGGLDSVQGPKHSQGFWLVISPLWRLLIGDLIGHHSTLKDSDWQLMRCVRLKAMNKKSHRGSDTWHPDMTLSLLTLFSLWVFILTLFWAKYGYSPFDIWTVTRRKWHKICLIFNF